MRASQRSSEQNNPEVQHFSGSSTFQRIRYFVAKLVNLPSPTFAMMPAVSSIHPYALKVHQ